MSDELKNVRIEGLSHADILELREFLDQRKRDHSDIAIVENTLPPHRLGEPVTFVVIAALTASGIGVIGAWLLKKRTRTDVRYTLTAINSDGTTRVETLELSRSESEAPSPEFMEKLSAVTSLPVGDLTTLITGSSE